MKLIGICGSKGSGKSVASNALKDMSYEEISFEDSLKNGLSEILSIDKEHFEDPELKERLLSYYFLSPKHLVSALESEWKRNMIPKNIWTNIMKEKLDNKSEGSQIVIPDVRSNEEAEFIKEYGGSIFLVHRDKLNSDQDYPPESGVTNDYVDKIITNNGSIRTFQETVIMEGIKEGLK